MTQESSERRYSREEVGDLIETASKLEWSTATSSDVSLEELKSIASELGISDAALSAALAKQRAQEERNEREIDAQRDEQRKRQQRVARAWRDWRAHIGAYVGVILGLTVMDALTGPGWWVQWPAVGWGIGLLSHTGVMIANRGDIPQ